MDAGLVLTFVGVVAAALPFFLAWRAATGPSRKLESLVASLEKLPDPSIARSNVLEAIDWVSRDVVRRERGGTSLYWFIFGFCLYFAGAIGAALFVFDAIRGFQMFGERAYSSISSMWFAFGCLVVAIVGLMLSVKSRAHSRRRRALARLDGLERQEIIRTHRRKHGNGVARPPARRRQSATARWSTAPRT